MTRNRTKVARLSALHLIGIVLSLVGSGPVFYIIWLSITRIGADIESKGISLENYTNLINNPMMLRWVGNSLLVAVCTSALMCVIDLCAAYTFHRVRVPGREKIFGLMIATMMLPFSITLIPTYLLVVRYGMLDTYWGLIIPTLTAPVGVFILRAFLSGIPNEIFEAAEVDGASHPRILWSIVFPMAREPLSVLAIITLVGSWTAFLWPLLVTQSDEMKTLPVGVASANLQFVTDTGSQLAQTVITIIPMALLFAFFQRYFLQGVTAGAVKD